QRRLAAHREAGAAAAAERRRLELRDQLVRRHRPRLRHLGVALVVGREQDRPRGHASSFTIAGTSSGPTNWRYRWSTATTVAYPQPPRHSTVRNVISPSSVVS